MTALVLFLDSSTIARHTGGGQWLSDLVTFCYLVLLVSRMRGDRKLLAVLFVPLSGLGECVFSYLLQLYRYRLLAIPLYVPLGHAVILSAGIGLADSPWVRDREASLRRWLIGFHLLVIAGAFVVKQDSFSLLLGSGFFCALYISRQSNVLYLIIGVLVLYVELLGTFWGCWKWGMFPFGVLRTANPPPGAFVCYVIAEVLAIRCAARVEHWWKQRGRMAPGPAVAVE